MIGSISSPVGVGSIVQLPGGIVVSPYYGFSTGYVPATTIEPMRGYWVKVNQNGQLILTGGMASRTRAIEVPETTKARGERGGTK
jgi:hypothetical protein